MAVRAFSSPVRTTIALLMAPTANATPVAETENQSRPGEVPVDRMTRITVAAVASRGVVYEKVESRVAGAAGCEP